ncbi:AlpA family phage regulatory protein [Aliiglaciecola sp. CAU 1673]|uniref:helix-turn-helix transcriptional regulator n=1 Tax=Aliiglaciecola sp. CAU 1673 TaxID=3032595 RepID=UPI0023DB8634|nr:AlpA family phage regulatory protein [Aliiglaciecola sp. CAU 1673]MDF2179101.1 AlpA family phage regulatory protein [Aliiglaciecola sp. CAU 1673]
MSNFRFLRQKEASDKFGLSKSTFYQRIKEGLLPPPVQLGGRAVGWLEHELAEVAKVIAFGSTARELKLAVETIVAHRISAQKNSEAA